MSIDYISLYRSCTRLCLVLHQTESRWHHVLHIKYTTYSENCSNFMHNWGLNHCFQCLGIYILHFRPGRIQETQLGASAAAETTKVGRITENCANEVWVFDKGAWLKKLLQDLFSLKATNRDFFWVQHHQKWTLEAWFSHRWIVKNWFSNFQTKREWHQTCPG